MPLSAIARTRRAFIKVLLELVTVYGLVSQRHRSPEEAQPPHRLSQLQKIPNLAGDEEGAAAAA